MAVCGGRGAECCYGVGVEGLEEARGAERGAVVVDEEGCAAAEGGEEGPGRFGPACLFPSLY